MSVEKWFILQCDGCGLRTEPNDEGVESVRDVRLYLIAQGWKHEKATALTTPRDLCPQCSPAKKEPSNRTDDPRQQDLF